MKYIKDITVLIMVVGLMGILGLIVVDEFQMANEHGGELDESVIGLLQMSLTGVIGVVGGYVGGSMLTLQRQTRKKRLYSTMIKGKVNEYN